MLAAYIQKVNYLLREAISLSTLSQTNYPVSIDIKAWYSPLYTRLTNQAHAAGARIVLDIALLSVDFFLSSDEILK